MAKRRQRRVHLQERWEPNMRTTMRFLWIHFKAQKIERSGAHVVGLVNLSSRPFFLPFLRCLGGNSLGFNAGH